MSEMLKTMKPDMSANEASLYSAFLELDTLDDVRCFLADLCTPQEIASFAERWAIARMLDQKEIGGYRRIAELTGASTTTVARVARFLHHEHHHGYRHVLTRIAANQQNREMFENDRNDPRSPQAGET
jgi:TrpR-related protein YerC/YecD